MVSGFVTCGPNQALVVSGCFYSRPLMVPGGRVFVWPVIQRVQRISLNTMTLSVESHKVYTRLGVPISVTGIAHIKIQGQNVEMLRTACEQLLGKSEEEIMSIAGETFEGHQRAVMAKMTVEEIYKNRKEFSEEVFEVTSPDLVKMGITVVSYTIKDISDDVGYLRALGKVRTAEVKRDARIAEAEAKRDAQIEKALAEGERLVSKFLNETKVAKAKRDLELRKAIYEWEINTKRADSELAFNLQAARTRQRIKEEQMQVKVVEKTKFIQVEEQEIRRRARHLEATIRIAAEADKYRLEKVAEANKNRIVWEAKGEAEAIRLKGEAEAFAIEAKAKADAEVLKKKAEALRELNDAAILDIMLDKLPRDAAMVVAPILRARHCHGRNDEEPSPMPGAARRCRVCCSQAAQMSASRVLKHFDESWFEDDFIKILISLQFRMKLLGRRIKFLTASLSVQPNVAASAHNAHSIGPTADETAKTESKPPRRHGSKSVRTVGDKALEQFRPKILDRELRKKLVAFRAPEHGSFRALINAFFNENPQPIHMVVHAGNEECMKVEKDKFLANRSHLGVAMKSARPDCTLSVISDCRVQRKPNKNQNEWSNNVLDVNRAQRKMIMRTASGSPDDSPVEPHQILQHAESNTSSTRRRSERILIRFRKIQKLAQEGNPRRNHRKRHASRPAIVPASVTETSRVESRSSKSSVLLVPASVYRDVDVLIFLGTLVVGIQGTARMSEVGRVSDRVRQEKLKQNFSTQTWIFIPIL